MTCRVHECLAFSDGCDGVGKTVPRNQSRIFVLRLPESATLATRVHPKDETTKEKPSR
jgi:hypothetical protein